MRRILFAILTIAVVSVVVAAQKTKTNADADASNTSAAKKQGRQIDLQSETRLTAQLQSALDTKHAKVGDRVILKTTEAVKQNGQTVIPQGAQLLGRVTDIQKETESTGESHISLLFDRLRSGSSEIPITATILSVTHGRTRGPANNAALDNDLMNQSAVNTRSTSPPRNNGGGLLGGVGNTVGRVVNTAGNVAGTTTNAVGSTVGATTSTVGNAIGSLHGIEITQSNSASAQGGSTLSLVGGNLRLESGATFNLSVSNSARAGNP